MIKTFRGLLADGGQDRIRLQTIKGKVGYQVIKFQGVPNAPGTADGEHIIKIYKTEQTSIDGLIDFTDSDLLASLDFTNRTVPLRTSQNVIFDNETVNQDIYITHSDVTGSASSNYYLELEVIPLDDAGAEYTTLKDMRSA